MATKQSLRDYYRILGVDHFASQEEIRSAYIRLAKQFHPDLHQSADGERWMKLINEAYEVLGDKRKRVLYDYVFFAINESVMQASQTYRSGASTGTTNVGGVGNMFARFILWTIDYQDIVNAIAVALLFCAISSYLAFSQVDMAAALFALLIVVGFIGLMLRVVAEFFARSGIRREEPWFDKAFTAVNYLGGFKQDLLIEKNASKTEKNNTSAFR
jgi:hypothetical protein